MPLVARIGDTSVGVCCCSHDTCVGWVGIIVSGASTKSSENSSTSRIGDIAVSCHSQIIVSGSGLQSVEGSPTGRIGDTTVGCTVGTIVSGASTKSVGG